MHDICRYSLAIGDVTDMILQGLDPHGVEHLLLGLVIFFSANIWFRIWIYIHTPGC